MQKVDAIVIKGINEGKESSFRVLYDNYFTYLCSCAVLYVSDPAIAQEIVNDQFVYIWENRAQVNYPIHQYLLTGIRFRCLTYLRNARHRADGLDRYIEEFLLFEEEISQEEFIPLEQLEQKEQQEEIEAFIEQLPGKCREIFKLYLYENLPPIDIAQQQGIQVSTVRVQIRIALEKIRERYGSRMLLWIIFIVKTGHIS